MRAVNRRVGQPLVDTLDLQHALHHPRAPDDAERDAVGRASGVPGEEHPEAGGIEEPDSAEIEDEVREANRPQLAELLVDGRNGGEVELADRTHQDLGPVRFDLAPERLELRPIESHNPPAPPDV